MRSYSRSCFCLVVAAAGCLLAPSAALQPLPTFRPVGAVASGLSARTFSTTAAFTRKRRRRITTAPHCCICINCKLVDRCKLYHWVEEMHEQPHVTDAPDFDPNDPQIQVFLRNETAAAESDDPEAEVVRPFLSTEYDVFACDAFVEDAGKWLRLMPDADYIPT